ncbi:hypothetical protein [Sphingomonas melonis]|uniref:Uncharacterized protein n=1 Tax=Sphingomonas melonis TaxID=152682 RepID=A0A7Y9FK49_9SPHN|nr:hypothetical protein [Sphingomonas melonis]NYD88755.1 hypothetical protein [Sphingomonas melonis]
MTEATTELQEGQTAPIEGAEGQPNADTNQATEATAPDPYEELARDAGWSPKEEWKGDPDKWRDPREFIKYGMKRSRESADELRGLKQSVSQIGKTAEVLQRRAVEEARREAEARFASAVENKDHEGARAAREELTRIDMPAQDPGPLPEVGDFMTRNSSWFGSNRAATALAQSITAQLAAQNVSPADQLKAAEEAVKADFPHLFGNARQPAKAPASVNAPASRAAQTTARPKGFSDLPAEAQKAGQDFLKRGMVKTLDDYAKVYLEENA